ncbi:MAG TPA: hypothetical protein VFC82_04585 [Actinomycetaceae bacterium]|nr:hypothetical protein [Actinomycetaceae bacterium]
MTATRTRLRWLVPVAALAVAIGAPAAYSAVAAADPALPGKTAEELLTDLAEAEPVAFSGEVTQTVDLGLPDLSALSGFTGPGGRHGGAAPFDPMTLASGTNDWRVWTNAADAAKLALVVDGGEYSLTYNDGDVWFWDSAAGEAAHGTAPEHAGTASEAPSVTPQQFAEDFLAHVEPSTTVTTSGTSTVAGRSAYDLVLMPDDAATKIGEVRLAVDSETSLPLAFEVTNTSGLTAIDVAFTSIDFSAPDAAVFEFAPPAGAAVTEMPSHDEKPDRDGMRHGTTGEPDFDEPVKIGEGWSTVLVMPAQDLSQQGFGMGDMARPRDEGAERSEDDATAGLEAILMQLPTVSGDWGSGKLFDGTLFSAILADDGRIAVGPVAPEALYDALAQ